VDTYSKKTRFGLDEVVGTCVANATETFLYGRCEGPTDFPHAVDAQSRRSLSVVREHGDQDVFQIRRGCGRKTKREGQGCPGMGQLDGDHSTVDRPGSAALYRDLHVGGEGSVGVADAGQV